jgi:hypothetical protein
VNACASIPEMAFRMTASTVGLMTFRNESSILVLANILVTKANECVSVRGLQKVPAAMPKKKCVRTTDCSKKTTDMTYHRDGI